MSMTREEAAHILEYSRIVSENFTQEAVTATYVMALAALRGPTREQVEKMRGEWARTYSPDNFWTEVWKCSYCGFEDGNGDCFDFCPECGQPKTEEAVDMVMERLEALYGKTD